VSARWRRVLATTLSGTAAVAMALSVVGLPAIAAPGAPRRAAPAPQAHAVAAGPRSTAVCSEHVYDRLFFGLGASGGAVSKSQWTRFLAEVVTPRFPDGLTVLRADGQWRAAGEPNVTIEPSRVVEIGHEDSPEIDRRLDDVIAIYKQRHRQRSVMLTRSRVQVCW
jgi:hypothetical protein